jgi:hypothetical protein
MKGRFEWLLWCSQRSEAVFDEEFEHLLHERLEGIGQENYLHSIRAEDASRASRHREHEGSLFY